MATFRLTLLAGCLAVPVLTHAHGGGLDAYGCHHNRKAGGYHCHRGEFSGQSFRGKDEMLRFAAGAAAVDESAGVADFTGRVVKVSDGDTLTVLVYRTQIRVRLDAIDAPERGQAFGKRSRQSLAELCAAKQAQVEDKGKDRYGRTIGSVTCAGVHANAEQVRRGMAWVFERYAPKDSPLYAMQDDARAARRGLWGDSRPVAPWEWRANRRP